MAVGSGIGSQFGIATESAYGTYTAPTRFPEVASAKIGKIKHTEQGGGLAAGRLVLPGSRRVITTQAAKGTVDNFEVANKGFGLFLSHISGTTGNAVAQGATAAYLQTYPLADNVGKSFTAQAGVPDAGGVSRPFSFLGCKITAAEFSCGPNERLTVKLEIDGRDVTEAQTLVAASYLSGLAPFHFAQMGFKWGTYGSEAAVQGVKKVTIRVERSLDVDSRYYANNAGLKSEPLVNDFAKVTGSIETDFVDKTIFADRYAADGSASLIWEFIGPTIATIYPQTFRMRVPMTFLNDPGTPQVDGPDIVSPTYAFEGLYDDTHPAVTWEYQSTDTAA